MSFMEEDHETNSGMLKGILVVASVIAFTAVGVIVTSDDLNTFSAPERATESVAQQVAMTTEAAASTSEEELTEPTPPSCAFSNSIAGKGYYVDLGANKHLSYGDQILKGACDFEPTELLEKGGWSWAGNYRGKIVSSTFEPGKFVKAKDGNVYFMPDKTFEMRVIFASAR